MKKCKRRKAAIRPDLSEDDEELLTGIAVEAPFDGYGMTWYTCNVRPAPGY